MPSVRNLILLSAFVLVASLVGVSVSLLSPPDSGGKARDSFGIKGLGFKALHDTLSESGIAVTRQFHPPRQEPLPATLVFLQPDPSLVQSEPVYLESLREWVEAGGRIVVAAGRLHPEFGDFGLRMPGSSEQTILKSLGLGEMEVLDQSISDQDSEADAGESGDLASDLLLMQFPEAWRQELGNPATIDVETSGTLASEQWPVRQLAVPGDKVGTLELQEQSPDGVIRGVLGPDQVDSILAAEFRRGAGSILVVAEPKLLSNYLLARADNSILAALVSSPRGEPVLVDEFYHGLAVRGNPLYLLTQPGYLAIALGLLAISAVVIWREAILLGPPLPEVARSRRDVGEYVSAMGRFYSLGHDARPFLVQRMRDGVLRELCEELRLPMETREVRLVGGALSRTAPRRGARIVQTFREIDAELADRKHWNEQQTLTAMRRLTACLSTNA